MIETRAEVRTAPEAPERRISRPALEVVKDYTELQGDGTPVLLVNRAGGNEPSLLGVGVATEVNNIRQRHGLERAKIVVPIVSPRERKILLEEFPDNADIEIDEEYGKIIKDITTSQGNFPAHLEKLANHYESTQRELDKRFSSTAPEFQTQSLDPEAGETAGHSPRNIIGSIDAGARLLVSAPRRYFMFPVMLSELCNAVHREQQQGQLTDFSESHLLRVAHKMREVEKQYTKAFLPKVNTLSGNYLDDQDTFTRDQRYQQLGEQPHTVAGRSRLYTPAMKHELLPQQSPDIESRGIYAMFSGTGSSTEQTRAVIQAANDAGLTVYTTPWAETEGAEKVPPSTLSDPRVEAIFGRSGWGTGWQAQNLAKPWFVDPYEAGDDPEIYFNNRLVERLRMGKVVDASQLSAQQLAEDIQALSPGLRRLNQKITEEFGTTDGIRYMAEIIAEDYIGKK
jgi:hypothetical protein